MKSYKDIVKDSRNVHPISLKRITSGKIIDIEPYSSLYLKTKIIDKIKEKATEENKEVEAYIEDILN